MTFDSVGGLYLAYDLLGGERGPLSKITRIVTYSLLAVVSYSLAGNLKCALIGGIGMGSIFGLQLDWIGAGKTVSNRMIVILSIARMFIMALATSFILSAGAAVIVGIGAGTASFFSHRLKLSPEFWYEASRKPVLTMRRLGGGLLLGSGMATFVYLGETISGDKYAFLKALHLGFAVGFGTGLIATISPFVEWYADNLPAKSMGYIGAVMFMVGFLIQAIPSMSVLLGI